MFPAYAAHMGRPPKLDTPALDIWIAEHPGWARDGETLVRAFTFPDFGGALGFAVRVGLIAEKRDHHPDLVIGWGKARVVWTTHDAKGITQLDLDLAELTDKLFTT